MRSEYRDLVAYREAVGVAQELYEAVASWPSFDRWSVGVQLMRAIDSVGANIAESAGRWHRQDERRFLLYARGSLYETEHWVATACERHLLDGRFAGRLAETARALNGLIRRRQRD